MHIIIIIYCYYYYYNIEFKSIRLVPQGKRRLMKIIHLSSPLSSVQSAAAPSVEKKKKRTLVEVLGGFMQIPIHSLIGGKML